MLAAAACSSDGGDPAEQIGFGSGDPGSTFVRPADRQPAPDLSGDLLAGGTYSLAEERGGDVVVVDVWPTQAWSTTALRRVQVSEWLGSALIGGWCQPGCW